MLETISGALLPMVVTFLLGFVAAWRGESPRDNPAQLRRILWLMENPHNIRFASESR